MTSAIHIRRVQSDDRVFIDMADDPANPCISCGACCAHYRVSFYCGEIAGPGGGLVPAELVSQVSPFIACMRGTEVGGGRCIALTGTIGQAGIGCSIYDKRPSTCRLFAAWDADGQPNPECQRMRARIGLAPLGPAPE